MGRRTDVNEVKYENRGLPNRFEGGIGAMRKSRFSDEQIAFALKQTESGASINKVCEMLGVSERTFYRWKSSYAGMVPSEIDRLKKLEVENAKLRKLVADMCLEKAMLQDLIVQKWSGMSAQQESMKI
jgi:putative transposase